jgi:uncharacterized phiE125 gp8 family phage protein
MRFTLSPAAVTQSVIDAVLPIEAARLHLRVDDGDDEDSLIAALSGAAIDAVQQYSGARLTEQNCAWRGQFDAVMQLGVGPVKSITEIRYWNAAGVDTVLPVSAAWIMTGNRVQAAPSAPWPASDGRSGAVKITFVAGYTDPHSECPSLVAAVKLMLGHLFVNREAVVTGPTATEIPMGVKALCDPYREIRI